MLYASGNIDNISFLVTGLVYQPNESYIALNHWGHARRMIEINNQLYYSIYSTPTTGDYADYYAQYCNNDIPPGHLNTIIIPTFLIYQH
jgi:hypothetical protein